MGIKKIVRGPYVSDGPLPPALPIPLLALWVFASGRMPAGRAAIVPHVACYKLAPAGRVALGSFGSFGSLF